MSSQKSNHIGQGIRKRRRDLGWTLKELASQVQVSEGGLSHIERGFRTPSARMLARLAAAMDCSSDQLLAGEAPVPAKNPYRSRVLSSMQQLPMELQEQVADYCDFLRQRTRRISSKTPSKLKK